MTRPNLSAPHFVRLNQAANCWESCEEKDAEGVFDPATINPATGEGLVTLLLPKCAGCGARSLDSDQLIILRHRTVDGFTINRPTCKHPAYFVCPNCREKVKGCPVCGCEETYT